MKNKWQTKKLVEICDLFADGDWIEKKDQSEEGIRLIQTGNVGNGFFKDRAEKARYISEKTFTGKPRKKSRPEISSIGVV